MHNEVLKAESGVCGILCHNLDGPSVVKGIGLQTSKGRGHAQLLLALVFGQSPWLLWSWSCMLGRQQQRVDALATLFVVFVEAPPTSRM